MTSDQYGTPGETYPEPHEQRGRGMSECYCDKHQTANHAEGSAFCDVWEVATRAATERIVAMLEREAHRLGQIPATQYLEQGVDHAAWIVYEGELASKDDT